MVNRDYLGVSTRNITSFSDKGEYEYASDIQNVIQSIASILSSNGEIFFTRNRNSNLRLLMFQPNDSVTSDLLRFFIIKAIEDNVKTVQSVTVNVLTSNQPNLLNAEIVFTVVNSNKVGSFIYPFFLQDTNGVVR